jgi:hypothetical protein
METSTTPARAVCCDGLPVSASAPIPAGTLLPESSPLGTTATGVAEPFAAVSAAVLACCDADGVVVGAPVPEPPVLEPPVLEPPVLEPPVLEPFDSDAFVVAGCVVEVDASPWIGPSVAGASGAVVTGASGAVVTGAVVTGAVMAT